MAKGWPTSVRKEMQGYLAQMPAFARRFRGARKRFAALHDTIPQTAVRWQWSLTPRYDLDPWFYGLDQTLRPGGLLKRTPSAKAGKSGYGFDASGRIVVVRDYTKWEGVYTEGLWEYSAGRIDATCFDYGAERYCVNVETLYFSGSQPVALVAYAGGGTQIRLYRYEKDRMVQAYELAECGVRNGRPDYLRNTYTLTYKGDTVSRIRLQQDTDWSVSWVPSRNALTGTRDRVWGM